MIPFGIEESNTTESESPISKNKYPQKSMDFPFNNVDFEDYSISLVNNLCFVFEFTLPIVGQARVDS